MPIRKSQKDLYPKNWDKISLDVRVKAGWRCEGSPKFPECRAEHGREHPDTGSMVILTVGHLDHDPTNCDRSNLKAWCNRCHLTYDAAHHAKNAASTRRAAKQTLELNYDDANG